MLLPDTSVWIDHIRKPDPVLLRALADDQLVMHRFVIGEVALGSLKNRADIIADMYDLHRAEIADHEEVMTLVERHALFGRGIGWVDAHLLAATLLTPGARLWTRDRRLREAAMDLGVAAREG